MTTAQGPASTSASHSSLFILDSVSRQQIAVILIQFRDTREASERQPFLHPPLHHIPSARASRPFAPAQFPCSARRPPYSLSPDGLYIEQTAIFRQSLRRPLTGLIRLLKPRQTQDFPGMKLPTRIFQDPPPTIFPGRKNPALSSKLSSGTFPETPSPTNILTTQTWLVPEGCGLEDFPGMVSWEIPGRGHFPGYF